MEFFEKKWKVFLRTSRTVLVHQQCEWLQKVVAQVQLVKTCIFAQLIVLCLNGLLLLGQSNGFCDVLRYNLVQLVDC